MHTMLERLDVPPVSFNTKNPQTPRRSWISSFAHTPITPAPPVPPALFVSSPDSSGRTIKVGYRPGTSQERDADTESGETESTHEEMEIKGEEKIEFAPMPMSPVEEVSEQMTPKAALRGKARSLVGLVGSGLRSLPRALTHSSMYDRTASTRSSYTGITSARTTTNWEHEGPIAVKYTGGPFPFIFAPPEGFQLQPPLVESPMQMSHPLSSKGEYEQEQRPSRWGSLLTEITSMPWMSSRVSVDYVPGESRARSIMPKTSSSWYTVPADAPSILSHPERLVPEPWFPPPELTPAIEVPGEEERAAEEENNEAPGETIERLSQELLEEKAEVHRLNQVVEHHKNTIARLEVEVDELRKEQERRDGLEMLQRRKSGIRQSLRAMDSLRASTIQRASVRVSKGPSFFD